MLEKELFVLLERTADAAFVLSDIGEIRYWNKAAERLLGYTAEDVRDKSCHEVLQGIGPLGTRVCHEGCRNSQLRYERTGSLWTAAVDQHIYFGL